MRTVRGRAEETEPEARIIHDGSSRDRRAEPGRGSSQQRSAIAAEALMNNAG
jgi:hypothetical protein